MHQITLFRDKKSEKFLGRGGGTAPPQKFFGLFIFYFIFYFWTQPPPQTQPQSGEGHPLPTFHLKDDLYLRLLLGTGLSTATFSFLIT